MIPCERETSEDVRVKHLNLIKTVSMTRSNRPKSGIEVDSTGSRVDSSPTRAVIRPAGDGRNTFGSRLACPTGDGSNDRQRGAAGVARVATRHMSHARSHPKLPRRHHPFVVAIAFLDALVVAAFLAFGLYTHGLEPWASPVYTVRTATPFVVAWTGVATVAGAYRIGRRESFRRTTVVVAGSWFAATVLGGALRSTTLFPGGAHPTFLLVVAGLGLWFVLPWRLAVTAGYRRLHSSR